MTPKDFAAWWINETAVAIVAIACRIYQLAEYLNQQAIRIKGKNENEEASSEAASNSSNSTPHPQPKQHISGSASDSLEKP